MKNKYKISLAIITTILLLTIGVTFAYYVMRVNFTGSGSSVNAITKEINDVEVVIEGNLEFNDTDILPGHKNISSIKLTATGDDKEIYYDLIWNGTNTLSSALNYTVYKVDSEKEVSMTCTAKEDYLIGEIRYYEECTMANESALGEAVSSGTISKTNSTSKIILKNQESITATSNGTETYYYVVLEFPNTEEEQEQVEGGKFEGTVTVEQALETAITPKDIILANMNEIRTETDFSEVATEEITGVIYKEVVEETTTELTNSTTPKVRATLLSENNDNVTYYFRGAPKDNYVKFAGFYWRIIRINENGSIRMIYSGKVSEVDAAGKESVLANGYDDSVNEKPYTHIGTSSFNANGGGYEHVGFMYSGAEIHGNSLNSDIKSELEEWYRNNILNTEFEANIDTESGFCSDRNYTISFGVCDVEDEEGNCIEGYEHYDYGALTRLNLSNYPTPTFGCPDSRDLYTVSSSSIGNKTLTYPIGLITADEVAYAGGVTYKSDGSDINKNYYLYTGNGYWTISPAFYSEHGGASNVFNVSLNGVLSDFIVTLGESTNWALEDEIVGVRPVINLSPTVTLTGLGTIDSPYEVISN